MNTIDSASHMGALGIQRGMQQIERGAASVAGAEPRNGARDDLAGSLVAMEEGKLQVQASARAVQAAVDVIGSLLDVTA